MAPKAVLVTGANGYIGNAVARAFVAAGWVTYGLVRSPASAAALAQEEILPVIGSIDDIDAHATIQAQLPPTIDAIVSTTENLFDYIPHYTNAVRLLRTLGTASSAAGVKPLVIFSSGCKDYGIGPHYHGVPGLAPHTEDSPVAPVPVLANRATYAAQIFAKADAFAPVLMRPTSVYGRASSYYRSFFSVAAQVAATAGRPLVLPRPANTIVHALHVDDCAEAYVAIASQPRRSEVEGHVFNISAHRDETLGEIAQALGGGPQYIGPSELAADQDLWPPGIIDFPQWTDLTKLRKVTGWQDHRPLFSEALHVYRVAAEAAEAAGNETVQRSNVLVASFQKAGLQSIGDTPK
ncbi:NAD dependent epimerase/dehydratase [Sporothrix brasiliensis 5110]|uniref:NAD dependent epimerase/dehydratase n=1 Tax=Sporothrix brasiliensis 5110 TaxID=1398154 RepID=A0A0C2J2R5_9PEZI|nr:NAD dependent epimerase/dehydratase [Sporothrix brasiliensis 5110]KIH93340.1 NAD dependent epimerase/dehydratase [Sporothrix brasiliensis 5110]